MHVFEDGQELRISGAEKDMQLDQTINMSYFFVSAGERKICSGDTGMHIYGCKWKSGERMWEDNEQRKSVGKKSQEEGTAR